MEAPILANGIYKIVKTQFRNYLCHAQKSREIHVSSSAALKDCDKLPLGKF